MAERLREDDEALCLPPGEADGAGACEFRVAPASDAGSDPSGIETTAEPLPGGGWRIRGEKWFVTSGDVANVLVVVAIAPEGPTLFAVPAPVLRTVLGEMAGDVLGSARVVPKRLLEAGFTVALPGIEDAVGAAGSATRPYATTVRSAPCLFYTSYAVV